MKLQNFVQIYRGRYQASRSELSSKHRDIALPQIFFIPELKVSGKANPASEMVTSQVDSGCSASSGTCCTSRVHFQSGSKISVLQCVSAGDIRTTIHPIPYVNGLVPPTTNRPSFLDLKAMVEDRMRRAQLKRAIEEDGNQATRFTKARVLKIVARPGISSSRNFTRTC